jgi:hypothetical protein
MTALLITVGREDLLPAEGLDSEDALSRSVLSGCDMFVILREDSSFFRVIGDCYCHGVMKGEIEALDAGKAVLVEFELR